MNGGVTDFNNGFLTFAFDFFCVRVLFVESLPMLVSDFKRTMKVSRMKYCLLLFLFERSKTMLLPLMDVGFGGFLEKLLSPVPVSKLTEKPGCAAFRSPPPTSAFSTEESYDSRRRAQQLHHGD